MSGERGARGLDVKGVDVHLGGVQILSGVTFDVRPGEAFGIVGPNGAGETTILNVISGVVRPTTGTVRYGDTDLLRILPRPGTRPSRCTRSRGRVCGCGPDHARTSAQVLSMETAETPGAP
jgi:ABC-type branched-subunit amino acid transport system ATPase component